MRSNRKPLRGITAPENFNPISLARNPGAHKHLGSYLRGGIDSPRVYKAHDPGKIYGTVFDAEPVVKSEFWNTALKGHLASLEPRGNTCSRTALLTLGPLRGTVTALARTHAAGNALPFSSSALNRLQIAEIHNAFRMGFRPRTEARE